MAHRSRGVPADTLILTIDGLRRADTIDESTPLLTERGVFICPDPIIRTGSTVVLIVDETSLEIGDDTLIDILTADDERDVGTGSTILPSQRVGVPVLTAALPNSVEIVPPASTGATLLWLTGRWLAEGQRDGGDFVFTTSRRLEPSLEAVLLGALQTVERVVDDGSVQLRVRDQLLADTLSYFLANDGRKIIPLGLLGHSLEAQAMIYAGFTSAQVAPAARELAVGLRLLAANLGQASPGTVVGLRRSPRADRSHHWSAVHTVTGGRHGIPLYHFDVPTYVADGISVLGGQ